MSKESFWEKFILADFFSRNLDQGKSGTDIFEKYKRQLEEEAREAKKQRVDCCVLVDLSLTEEERESISMSEARDDDFPSNEKSGFASQLHRHANRLLHPNQTLHSQFLHANVPENDNLNLAVNIPDLNETSKDDAIPLEINQQDSFLEVLADLNEIDDLEEDEDVVSILDNWNPDLKQQSVSPKAAVEILKDVTQIKTLDLEVEVDIVTKEEILKVNELLRHFWFHSENPQRIERILKPLIKIRERLVSSTSPLSLEIRNSLITSISQAIAYKQTKKV